MYKAYDGDSTYPSLGAPFFGEHLARYLFAQDWTNGKNVLELACGKGYGSYLMAQNAKSILSLDLNEQSLQFAERHYSKNNLTFARGDVCDLSNLKQSFDVIVAFEIIEHLPPANTEAFLRGISEHLNPGGVALISTPNHEVVLKSGVEVPDFHINNLKATELRKFLSKHFSRVKLYGQVKSKGTFKNILYGLDVFHLRHLGVFQKLRAQSKQASTSKGKTDTAIKPPDSAVWVPEMGFGESTDYFFSPWYWRQAGMVVAVCRI